MSDYEMIEAIQCELGRYSEELVPVGDGKVTLLQGTVIKFPMLTTQEGNSVYRLGRTGKVEQYNFASPNIDPVI